MIEDTMPHDQMIDAFSAVIQNSLSLYENQTPLYYQLIHYGSWAVFLLGIISLKSALSLSNLRQKRFHLFMVSVLLFWFGGEGIKIPHPNLGVFYGYHLAEIAYPPEKDRTTFLLQSDFSNPICCSISEGEYLQAKRLGFKEYADAKAKALVDLVEIEKKSKQSD